MWILIALLILMPFEMSPYLHLSDNLLGIPEFTVIKLLGLVGVAWSAFALVTGKVRLDFFGSAQARAFSLYLVLIFVASIWTGAGLVPFFKLISRLFFLPLILVAVRKEEDVLLSAKTAVMMMILVFPYAYRQMVRFGGRLGVGLYEPNYVALGLILLLPLTFAFAGLKTGKTKSLWLLGFGVLVVEVVLTGSRGGFLGLVIVVFFAATKLTRRPVMTLAGLACVLLVVLLVVPNSLTSRLMASVGEEGAGAVKASDRARLVAIRAGLRMIREHPLVGVGLGNFKPTVALYEGEDEAKIAHNTYLEICAELGIPVFLVFLSFIYATLSSLRRSERLASSLGNGDLWALAVGLRAGLTGYLVSATFLSAQYEKFFFFVVFLSIALERILKEQKNRRSKSLPTIRPGLEAAG